MEPLRYIPDVVDTYTVTGDFEKYLQICEKYREIGYVDVLYDSGIIFVNMAPPSRRHNAILARVADVLQNSLKDRKSCRVLSSGEEYILMDSSRTKPDVSVVCADYEKGLMPILAVEVLSPANGLKAPEHYEYYFGKKISKLNASGCKTVLCLRYDFKLVYVHTQGYREYASYRLDDYFTVPGLDIDLCVSNLYPENWNSL